MKMTYKLANQLMDTLACVAISAYGGATIVESGEPTVSDEVLETSQAYARETFMAILNEWEEASGEEWEIEDPTNEDIWEMFEEDDPRCYEDDCLDELFNANDDPSFYDEGDYGLEVGFNPYEGCYDFDC